MPTSKVLQEVLQDALMEVLMPAIASLPAPGKREREEPKQEVPWRTCSGKGGSLSGKGGGATTSSGDVELKEDHGSRCGCGRSSSSSWR